MNEVEKADPHEIFTKFIAIGEGRLGKPCAVLRRCAIGAGMRYTSSQRLWYFASAYALHA